MLKASLQQNMLRFLRNDKDAVKIMCVKVGL